MGERTGPDRTEADRWRRLLLLGALVVGACLAVWVASRYLTYAELQKNHRALEAWRDAHLAASVLAYAAVYITAVAFSVPGAVWMTLIGGLLFGVAGGAALVVVSATIGATLIFLAARTVLSAFLRRRAGGWVERMGRGFRGGEISFLLIMRLVPAVPFFIANLVPAFLGARLRHFVWTTFVGIAPATLVYASIGSGLGEQLARGQKPDLGVIFEPHILAPLLGLAALAALPLLLRHLGIGRAQRGPAE
jgi:uncharacterized membrane protein YdjX (TVP38/TMEM64 family)